MTISDTSTTDEVIAAALPKFIPSDADLKVWSKLTAATGDSVYTTLVGLFGADLTAFLADCTTSTECKEEDYSVYTGWAFGIQWTGTAVNSDFTSVTFADNLEIVGCFWSSTAADNAINNGVVTEVSATKPGSPDGLASVNDKSGPFDSWDGVIKSTTDKLQYAVHFLETDNDFYFETGDSVTLWNHLNLVAGVSTDVTLGNAVQLTATAGAIIAATLLF